MSFLLKMKYFTGKVEIEEEAYTNGGTCLRLTDEEGLVATATVWVPGLETNEVCIKDYSENEGMLVCLVENDIVEEPHREVQSGFVTVPVCRLKE